MANKIITYLLVLLVAFTIFKVSCGQDSWEDFKKKYNKSYSDEEDKKREEFYKENIKKISDKNGEEGTYKLASNQFADMKYPDEFKCLVQSGVKYFDLTNSTDTDSKNFNMTENLPPIRDQGQCCYSSVFAAISSLEGAFFKKFNSTVELSEQEVIDCQSVNSNGKCGGLGDLMYPFTYFVEGGVSARKDYDFTGNWSDTCHAKDKKRVAYTTGFMQVAPDESILRDQVENVGSVAVTIDGSSFDFIFYSSGFFHCDDLPNNSSRYFNLTHTLNAVGYGNDEKNGNFWILRNSWGKSWGNYGYMYLKRNSNNTCGIATHAFVPIGISKEEPDRPGGASLAEISYSMWLVVIAVMLNLK